MHAELKCSHDQKGVSIYAIVIKTQLKDCQAQHIYQTFTRIVGPLLGVISWAEVHCQLASFSQIAQHARAWHMKALEP